MSIPFSGSVEIVIQPYVREAANTFFASEEGRIILEALAAMRPDLLPGGALDQVALRSAQTSGYELVFQNLQRILRPPPPPPAAPASPLYPPLDDESKWT